MVYNPDPSSRDEETALAPGVASTTTAQVFVNPQIVDFGKEQDYMAEGCLSFPRRFAEALKRWMTAG